MDQSPKVDLEMVKSSLRPLLQNIMSDLFTQKRTLESVDPEESNYSGSKKKTKTGTAAPMNLIEEYYGQEIDEQKLLETLSIKEVRGSGNSRESIIESNMVRMGSGQGNTRRRRVTNSGGNSLTNMNM